MSQGDEKNPRLAWTRNAVANLFDVSIGSGAVCDEEGWERLVGLIDETGRLLLGYPAHVSSESDIFGALDDIAAELEATKNAIAQTTKEARIAQHELHKALEPLLPEEGEADSGPETAPSEASATNPPVPRPPEMLEPTPKNREEQPVAAVSRSDYPGAPQTPNVQDEAMFALVRADPTTSYAAIERRLEMSASRARQRMVLLAGYGTLPEDIAAWQKTRKAGRQPGTVTRYQDGARTMLETEEQAVREVAAEIKARELQPIDRAVSEVDSFEARRRIAASQKAGLAWQQRTGERPA